MKKIFVVFLCFLIVPMVAFGNALDDRISALIAEKQDILAQLEECQKSNKGFKIAGLATLGVSAIGVGVNIGEAVKIKDYDRQIEAANNTCGSNVCQDSADLEALGAKSSECIKGKWVAKDCKDDYTGTVQKCKRNGQDITYYEKCDKPAEPKSITASANMLDEFVVTAHAGKDECQNKAFPLSSVFEKGMIRGWFHMRDKSIHLPSGSSMPTLENFGGKNVLYPVHACPGGQYLNVSNIRKYIGSVNTNKYSRTNIAISSGIKCADHCKSYPFKYEIINDRGDAFADDVEILHTGDACLVGEGLNTLLGFCVDYCKEHRAVKENALNQEDCKITGVALDFETQNCLCNPTGVTNYQYHKDGYGNEL